MSSAFQSYERKKEQLSRSVRQAASEKGPSGFSLRKKSSNLFRQLPSPSSGVQISKKDFNKVLLIDPSKGIAEVEGMATYEDIVAETLKFSCLPTVVPELKTITLGGAVSGCGIESSSFRHGLVHEGMLEFDLLLADGRVITCSPENQYKDIFFGIPNSYGTFGYILKAKIALQPAKKFVRLQHINFGDPSSFFREIERMCHIEREKGGAAFIEGVVFHPESCYITIGSFVDEAPFLSDYKYMQIYYQSIRKKQEDFLTAADYIWRWDPDWFWCSKVFYMQNPLVRFLLGKWMLRSSVYTKIMHKANKSSFFKKYSKWMEKIVHGKELESVIQDVLIPIEQTGPFFEFYQKEVGIFPLWICPYRSKTPSTRYDFCPVDSDRLYMDFGFWDAVPIKQAPGQLAGQLTGQLNREIERQVQQSQGFKSLYSRSYYTPEEFWQIYNRRTYDQLKQIYDPNSLLCDLYTKVGGRALTPPPGGFAPWTPTKGPKALWTPFHKLRPAQTFELTLRRDLCRPFRTQLLF